MAKRKKSSPANKRVTRPASRMVVVEYEITSEPIIEGVYKSIPESIRDRLSELYTIIQEHPEEAIPELETLLQQYPQVPNIYNYLSTAYLMAGEEEKAKQMIEEAYRRHPDYLFARVNYAEICIHRNELEAIPVIFNHKFDLKLLYPRRKKFHTSEMIAFMGVLGLYFHATGDRALAKNAYEVLYRLAPDHTYTKRLRQLLYPNLLAWFLENMK